MAKVVITLWDLPDGGFESKFEYKALKFLLFEDKKSTAVAVGKYLNMCFEEIMKNGEEDNDNQP